jgi:hypothetical protein
MNNASTRALPVYFGTQMAGQVTFGENVIREMRNQDELAGDLRLVQLDPLGRMSISRAVVQIYIR